MNSYKKNEKVFIVLTKDLTFTVHLLNVGASVQYKLRYNVFIVYFYSEFLYILNDDQYIYYKETNM